MGGLLLALFASFCVAELRVRQSNIRSWPERTQHRKPFDTLKTRQFSQLRLYQQYPKTPQCPRSLVLNEDLEFQLKRLVRNRRLGSKGQDGHTTPAIAFDIDGVFKMGGAYTSFGARALRKVIDANIPYVLMTNGGGGRIEEQYSAEVNKKLEMFDEERSGTAEYVNADKMILSYTPFNHDLAYLKNEPVLIVGCKRVIDAANHYGFKKAMHISEYTCKHPLINPFGTNGEKDDCVFNVERETWEEDFKAVLVFTDPEDFFEGVQVITDVILSSKPGEIEVEKGRRIPVVFSNPDLLWKTQYKQPRFGQGAFRLALEACYKARLRTLGFSEEDIQERMGDFIQYGKPEVSQFRFAKRALLDHADKIGCDISKYYMIGDNPTSDIVGAKNMDKLAVERNDKRWSGLLVKTGVYKDGDSPLGADRICENVLEAVDYIIEQHKDEILKNNVNYGEPEFDE